MTHNAKSSCRLACMSKRKTPAKEVKPASTAELRREGRLARIAKALVFGATVTEIAEAEGISRTLASRGPTRTGSPACNPCTTSNALWPDGRPRHNAAHTCDVSQSTDSWSNALRYLSITARIAWRAASVSGCTSSSTFVRS